jgi:hypothetical protein
MTDATDKLIAALDDYISSRAYPAGVRREARERLGAAFERAVMETPVPTTLSGVNVIRMAGSLADVAGGVLPDVPVVSESRP